MEARPSIEERGGELVVFYNATRRLVESWRRRAEDIPTDLPIVVDENAVLYDALGVRRKSNYAQLIRGSVGPVIAAAREGKLPRRTSADMLRLGADVVVREDGEIIQLHLADTPDDRLSPDALVRALG